MHFEPLSSWLPAPSEPLIISGPCGAESYEQVMRTARGLKALNRVALFRAGVWKPRTRPNAFEGKGEEALKWLQDVKKEYGFKLTVEVANAHHAELAIKYGVDVLWIGARTTVNPFSVQEIAEVLKGVNVAVMVKNPIHADLQLWIGGIERIYNSGIRKIAAIHRGFYFYGKTKYRNKPLWQLPIELRTQFPDLPLICDPSHIGGTRELLLPIAQKALDLGMNGLMIESHCEPEKALSDAQQQVTPEQLGDLLSKLVLRKLNADNPNANTILGELRRIIDEVDDELLNVLKKRTQIIEEIGKYKKEHHIISFQLERWQEILRTRGQWADKLGLSRQHVEKICQLLHEESIRIQNGLMNE
ncbi:MAG: chorismate mutase [bacterium]|nr:chorismate mutase [bacterium]